jgi:hypothetical protein
MAPLQNPDLIQRARDYCSHQANKGLDSLVDLMRRTGDDWRACLDGMSEKQAEFAPKGEWSTKEVVTHFLAATDSVNSQIRKITAGQEPGRLEEPQGKPTATQSVAELQAATKKIYDECAALTAGLQGNANLAKEFPHPAFGHLNITQWIAFQRLHGMDHMQQIEKNKADARYPKE